MRELSMIFDVLFTILPYVNICLALFSLIYNVQGAKRAQRPWKTLKMGFSLNMAIVILIYTMDLLDRPTEPLFIRGATTLLLICLAASAYLGVDRDDKQRDPTNHS